MSSPALRLALANAGALAHEFESNLQYGRAFLKDAGGVDVLSDCMLVLVHPDDAAELHLEAQAVMVAEDGAMRGVGVELRPFDDEVRARIERFVHGDTDQTDEMLDTGAGSSDGDAERRDDERRDAAGDDDSECETERQRKPPRHEELRKLSNTEQQKIARKGPLNDRVIVERLYGKNVWASLLGNPKITIPEVARIARKGTAPRPLIAQIVDNNTWVQAAIVRRALLGNPRTNQDAIIKLLRMTPKHELKTIVKTATYSSQVRDAARQLLNK